MPSYRIVVGADLQVVFLHVSSDSKTKLRANLIYANKAQELGDISNIYFENRAAQDVLQ